MAAKENAEDMVGGAMPDPEVEDPLVRGILGEMAKRNGLDSSKMMAKMMLTEFRKSFPIKYSKPKHARFAVLTTLEIPSILVEVDYISNSQRERLLRSKKNQQQRAKAMYVASVDCFKRMGRMTHPQLVIRTVHKGDSLWAIAKNYGLSVARILKTNDLKKSTKLKVGQRLRMPQS